MYFRLKYCSNGYRQTSNIRRIWIGNKIVDHSDVVEASAVNVTQPTS